jgi:NifU-like protein involved in Fe-S cluster formation
VGKAKYKTVAEIADIVKKQIDIYRNNTSKKDKVIEVLRTIFDIDAELRGVVIDEDVFKAAFKSSLRKRRMAVLKKLLYSLDEATYQKVDFEVK